MLVRRLSSIALFAGLPLVLAHCSSDSDKTFGSGAGAPAAGAPAAGAPAAGSSAGGSANGGSASAGAPAAGAPAAGAANGGAGSSAGGASGGATSGGSGGSSAGAAGKAGGASGGSGGGGGGSTGGTFTLKSAEIAGGMTIPEAHTCDGKGGFMDWGVAPSFTWSNPPSGTMSYAFFMIDWTLTMGASPSVNGYHSGAWNIPTSTTTLAKGWAVADLGTGAKAINGGYLGPCPPSGTDTYHMIIMALPMASYTINGTGTAGVQTAYNQLKGVALATAELTGTYKKK